MIKKLFSNWFIPVLFALILLLSVGTLVFVAANTYTDHVIAQSTHEIVQQHNTDIKTTEALTKKIYTLQTEHQSLLQTINQEGAAIQGYAQKLSTEISTNHTIGVKNLQYICSTIPGCDPSRIISSGGS